MTLIQSEMSKLIYKHSTKLFFIFLFHSIKYPVMYSFKGIYLYFKFNLLTKNGRNTIKELKTWVTNREKTEKCQKSFLLI